jgi:hypothetical protein
VNQLQLQLAEMESLLEQERKAHTNQLQSQREGYEVSLASATPALLIHSFSCLPMGLDACIKNQHSLH